MYKYRFHITIMLTFLWFGLQAQTAHKQLREADKAYKSGNYSKAEDNYRKTWVEKNNTKGGFNLGNTLYQQQDRYEEAVNQYESIAEAADNPDIQSKAYYNLGNAHFQQQAYDKSVEAYKQALRINSQDEDTRKNLMTAMQRLRQQQQQMQQQQQQQDQKEQDEEQEQDQQQQQQQQNQDAQQQKPQEQQEQTSEEPRDLNKEEAEQLLKIIEQEEQKVQEKLRKASSSDKKPKKKW